MKTPTRVLSAQGTEIRNDKSKGIWLWTADFVASKPDTVLDNCRQAHITEIYVPYATNKATIAQYQYFIRKASSFGIEVHALDGDPMWSLTTGRVHALNVIDSVNGYNAQSEPDQRFAAIQLDVEPHGLNGASGYPNNWNTDKAGTIAQWIDNTDVWMERANQYGITLGGAFAFWLDEELPTAAYTPLNLAQVMVDKYDYYAIMAYNEEPNQVITISNTEVNHAKTAKVVVGIETIKVSPETVTFYEEGFATAEDALKIVDDSNQGKSGYRGVAIHSYEQWEKFLAPYSRKNPIRINLPVRVLST